MLCSWRISSASCVGWWWLLLLSLLKKQYSNFVWNSLVFSYLASHSEWRCLRCLSFRRWWKTEKNSCRSNIISMRSYPPQYPRSSTRLNPSSSLFLILLRSCTAPPSCSLQALLKLSLLSLGPSLRQFVCIVSPLLNHGNPSFEPVCMFLPFRLRPVLFW